MRRVLVASLITTLISFVGGGPGAGLKETLPELPEERAATEPIPDGPNVLVIVTDDQPKGTMQAMPKTHKIFARDGVTYANAYVTTPLCCPSRASIFSGRYIHNHDVVNNSRDLDANDTFQAELDRIGYRTALFGKYLNSWWGERASEPVPYFDVSHQGYNDAHDKWDTYSDAYLGAKAKNFLQQADREDERPWAMVIATRSPHSPFVYPKRYKRLRFGRWRKPLSVGENLADKPLITRQRAERKRHKARRANQVRLEQMRMLAATDDMIADVFEQMKQLGEARETLAFFISDNGFFWGQHGLVGKDLPYREAVEVPMYARWPGRLRAGKVSRELVANIDIAPTIFDAAAIKPAYEPDGRSLLRPVGRRYMLTEGANMRWQAIIDRRGHYIRWDDGQREFYRLDRDPYEIHNLLAATPRKQGKPGKRRGPAGARIYERRLDRVSDCAGSGCHQGARHLIDEQPTGRLSIPRWPRRRLQNQFVMRR